MRSVLQFSLLSFDLLPQVLDLALKAQHLLFVRLQLFVFLLALEGSFDHDSDVGLDRGRHLLLLLSELLGFFVQLLGLRNNFFLLVHELVVYFALLSLFLE